MKILRIADVPRTESAGVSGYTLSSSAAVENLGHTVQIWFREDLLPQISSGPVRRLLVPWLILAKFALSGRRAGFDVVELHEPLSAPYALAARLIPGLPAAVVMSHGLEERGWLARLDWERRGGTPVPWHRRMIVWLTLIYQARAGHALARASLVLSSADAQFLQRERGIADDRIFTVFGGVRLRPRQAFKPDHRSAGVLEVLFIGTWIERKGVENLIDAWAKVELQIPDARLTLAGIGDDREQAAHAAVEGLKVRIVPSFPNRQVARLLDEHSVFVLPSWFEGMSLVVLEAASAGLPCVVSAVGGHPDVFRMPDPRADGGILVEPYDIDGLARALIELLEDEPLRRRMGIAAEQRAREFSWAANGARCLEAYAHAASAQRATSVAT